MFVCFTHTSSTKYWIVNQKLLRKTNRKLVFGDKVKLSKALESSMGNWKFCCIALPLEQNHYTSVFLSYFISNFENGHKHACCLWGYFASHMSFFICLFFLGYFILLLYHSSNKCILLYFFFFVMSLLYTHTGTHTTPFSEILQKVGHPTSTLNVWPIICTNWKRGQKRDL